MKKIYQNPKLEVVKICTFQMMASSINVNNSTLNGEVEGDGRGDDGDNEW